jgi:cytosine permease
MASHLPDYVASARPVPLTARAAWYKTTAQTYAGIMLWFVFWESVPISWPGPGGILAHGLVTALAGVIAAALICHFASYLAPGLMGMKTGLPLAVVGTSTYGVYGGFLMPGFFMGILQFGWLAVNAFFSAELLARLADQPTMTPGHPIAPVHMAIGAVWVLAAALVGLKGIHYVARVATFLPLIPLVILLILTVKTFAGVADFKPALLNVTATTPLPSGFELALFAIANIVGFFATAGAAGVDIASSNRDTRDVHLGGLVGVAGATIFTGCLALLIVAGTYGGGLMPAGKEVVLKPTALMSVIMGEHTAKVFWLLLAIAAFPPACFSSLIAAASFRNTLPKVSPFISCGLGAAASIALVLSGKAGNAAGVFTIIGASFGPICGAMTADYLLAGCKWPGPRAGFNPAGWISWAVGFVVGAWNAFFADLFRSLMAMAAHSPHVGAWKAFFAGLSHVDFQMPCPPVAAIIVGFVLYLILALIGLQTRTLEMPALAETKK